jgi:hypothetical protein
MHASGRSSNRARRPRESGAVLITVMLVMLALLGLGVMALWMTSGSLQIGANTNLRNQALYVAEAGIEAARNDLNTARTAADLATLLQGGKDPANDDIPAGPPYVYTNAALPNFGQPKGVGAVYFYANNAPLSNVAFPPASFTRGSTGNSSTTMGTYTVWIRNDTAELRQGILLDDGGASNSGVNNGIVVVRSRGVAPDGRTQVTIEVAMGPGATPGSTNPAASPAAPVLCNAGKNACDENSSVQSGIVVQ